jgi:opacity protein-like surface antigen
MIVTQVSSYCPAKVLVAAAAIALIAGSAQAQTSQAVAPARSASTAAKSSSPPPQPAGDPLHFYIGLTGATQSRAIGEDINLGTAAEWGQGFGISESFGYRWNSGYRFEFEMGLLDNPNVGFWFPPYPNGGREESAGHVTLKSYMLNGYYNFALRGRMKPFISGGWGVTESRINGVTSKTLQSGIPGVFAATVLDTASRYTKTGQVRVGIDIQASQRFGLTVHYKYFRTGQLNFKTVQFPDVQVKGAKINALEGGVHIFLF